MSKSLFHTYAEYLRESADEQEFADRLNVVRDAFDARTKTRVSEPGTVVDAINESMRLTPVNSGKAHVLSLFGHVVSGFPQDEIILMNNEPCV